MGIENLLQFIKPLMELTNLDKFAGTSMAVDGMSWLYRSCYSSFNASTDILEKDLTALSYQQLSPWALQYFSRYMQLFKFYKIRIIVVFDGRSLQSKRDTLKGRKQRREQNFEQAKTYFREGNLEQANKFLKRCVVVGRQQVEQMVDFVRQLGYEFVIAPYEADAQIAYMCKNNIVEYAVTEDSDLVPFGFYQVVNFIDRCTKIIYKLESSGACQYLDLNKFKADRQNREHLNDLLRIWLTFDEETTIISCVMAGCDYLPSIKGVYDPITKIFTTLNPISEGTEMNDDLIGIEFNQLDDFISGNLNLKTLQTRKPQFYDLKNIIKIMYEPKPQEFNADYYKKKDFSSAEGMQNICLASEQKDEEENKKIGDKLIHLIPTEDLIEAQQQQEQAESFEYNENKEYFTDLKSNPKNSTGKSQKNNYVDIDNEIALLTELCQESQDNEKSNNKQEEQKNSIPTSGKRPKFIFDDDDDIFQVPVQKSVEKIKQKETQNYEEIQFVEVPKNPFELANSKQKQQQVIDSLKKLQQCSPLIQKPKQMNSNQKTPKARQQQSKKPRINQAQLTKYFQQHMEKQEKKQEYEVSSLINLQKNKQVKIDDNAKQNPSDEKNLIIFKEHLKKF